jgi:hypothetical protein
MRVGQPRQEVPVEHDLGPVVVEVVGLDLHRAAVVEKLESKPSHLSTVPP